MIAVKAPTTANTNTARMMVSSLRQAKHPLYLGARTPLARIAARSASLVVVGQSEHYGHSVSVRRSNGKGGSHFCGSVVPMFAIVHKAGLHLQLRAPSKLWSLARWLRDGYHVLEPFGPRLMR